jgi:hypothetical protein
MKISHLLPLGLCTAAALLSTGCATQKTHSGTNTYILGGLVTVKTGDYQPAAPTSAQLNGLELIGKGNPSGTSVSFGYDAVKYTDY